MSLVEHIGALKAKHAELESAIALEIRRPLPDDSQIAQLKRRKLRLKDEIEGFAAH